MSDLISRQDAIDAIMGEPTDAHYPSWYADRIKALPSAEPKTGEWIDRSDGGRIKYPWWESCKCNQCGEYGSGAYNFCPNCGARMKGADDED